MEDSNKLNSSRIMKERREIRRLVFRVVSRPIDSRLQAMSSNNLRQLITGFFSFLLTKFFVYCSEIRIRGIIGLIP